MGSQFTMDLFCNFSLVKKINKPKSTMRLRSYGSKMMALHKEKVPGYDRHVWFSENSITNIFYLKNLGDQYLVTYRSEKMFSFPP